MISAIAKFKEVNWWPLSNNTLAGIAACSLIVLSVSIYRVVALEHVVAMQDAYGLCLAYSKPGSSLQQSRILTHRCAAVFEDNGEVVRLIYDANSAWVRYRSAPVTRQTLLDLHEALIDAQPDLRHQLPDFNDWWRHLPVGSDAPK